MIRVYLQYNIVVAGQSRRLSCNRLWSLDGKFQLVHLVLKSVLNDSFDYYFSIITSWKLNFITPLLSGSVDTTIIMMIFANSFKFTSIIKLPSTKYFQYNVVFILPLFKNADRCIQLLQLLLPDSPHHLPSPHRLWWPCSAALSITCSDQQLSITFQGPNSVTLGKIVCSGTVHFCLLDV